MDVAGVREGQGIVFSSCASLQAAGCLSCLLKGLSWKQGLNLFLSHKFGWKSSRCHHLLPQAKPVPSRQLGQRLQGSKLGARGDEEGTHGCSWQPRAGSRSSR